MAFTKREIKTPKITVKFEIVLNESTLEFQEALDKIEYELKSPSSKAISELVVSLLRASRASTWEMDRIDIT